MQQNSDEEGEINLLNSSYSTNRFAFSYSWWSAYGYKNHCRSDLEVAEAMKLTNQADVYQGCGAKVMADLMDGNAVVLFAYGDGAEPTACLDLGLPSGKSHVAELR